MKDLKWTGTFPTAIRLERNGVKVNMEPEQVLKVTDEQAQYYEELDKRFEIVRVSEENPIDSPSEFVDSTVLVQKLPRARRQVIPKHK